MNHTGSSQVKCCSTASFVQDSSVIPTTQTQVVRCCQAHALLFVIKLRRQFRVYFLFFIVKKNFRGIARYILFIDICFLFSVRFTKVYVESHEAWSLFSCDNLWGCVRGRSSQQDLVIWYRVYREYTLSYPAWSGRMWQVHWDKTWAMRAVSRGQGLAGLAGLAATERLWLMSCRVWYVRTGVGPVKRDVSREENRLINSAGGLSFSMWHVTYSHYLWQF